MPKKATKAADRDSGSEDEDIADAPSTFNTSELLKNPALLAAMQNKLQGLVGVGSGYIESLPQCMKARINALKNIQVECAKIEGKFYEEAHELEMKYAEHFKPLFEKRSKIVNGLYEPSTEEATWIELGEDDEEKDEDKTDDAVKKSSTEHMPDASKTDEEKITEDVKDKLSFDENTKGIPEFWLTSMKNVGTLSEMIQPHDEDILKHLVDLKLIFTGKKHVDDSADDEMGFVLEFHFSPNDYFTNQALSKTYKMKSEPDPEDPFSFEGPDIVGCTGCKIDWKKGKNVTEKVVKKKQKHKGRGQTRVITKTVKNDSFFNFFDPPEVPEDGDEMDDDTEELLRADFEIGHFMRERLIPKAVLFFTGEAIEDDSDDDDEYEDEEGDEADDDEDDDDDEKDPEYKPAEKPQECKQQ